MERFHGWDRRPQCNTMHTHNAMQRARSGLDSPRMRVPFIKSERAARAKTANRDFNLYKWCRIEIWVAAGCHSRAGLCARVYVFRLGVPVLKAPRVRGTWEAREPRSAPGCIRSAALLTDVPPFERLDSGFIQLLLVCFWVHFKE